MTTPRARFCDHLMHIAERGDAIDDASFAGCCYRAVSEFGFDPASLRDTLDIGAASFERWMTGASLPHAMIRAKVVLAMVHHLREK